MHTASLRFIGPPVDRAAIVAAPPGKRRRPPVNLPVPRFRRRASMTEPNLPSLSALEARVLGVLIEKQLTTPDYYPLTLNALLAGCNQKTSRHPVMSLTEAEVQAALDALKRRTLVIDSYGASGRVMRYAHNLPKVLDIGQAITALLAALMLRGAQTAAELRG